MLLALLLVVACDDMTDQRRLDPYAAKQGSPATPPAGTVEFAVRGVVPPAVTMALLQRGQDQFHAFCAPCHSELGDGRGMIVQRGFPAPPSYHIDRLRAAPPAHFYDVISNGQGAMYGFAQRVAPPDRWAIVAYIRALQDSQHATADRLTEADKAGLAQDRPE
jgi:mono/diheme cytochrome c family protein